MPNFEKTEELKFGTNSPNPSNLETGKLQLLKTLLAIAIFFGGILLVKNYLLGNYTGATLTFIFLVILAADLVFTLISKKYAIGSLVGVASFGTLIPLLLIYGAGAMFVWVPVFGSVASFLLSPSRGFILSMILYMIVASMLLLNGLGLIYLPFPENAFKAAPDFLASILILFIFIYLFQKSSAKKDELIQESYEVLEKESAKDKSVFSTIEMGLLTTDQNKIVSFINDPGLELLGAKANQVIGKNIEEIMVLRRNNKGLSPEESPFTQALTNASTVRIRLYDNLELRKFSDKFFPVGMNITYSPEGSEGKLIVVFFDISADKKIDELKDVFLSSMQHQISTPFAIVRWNLELLGQKTEDLKKMGFTRKGIVEDTKLAIDRITDIQSKILTASRIEQGFFPKNPESIDLRDVVSHTIEDLAPLGKQRKISFKKRYHDIVKPIKADRTILSIITQNLLSNAAKYSKVGGVVTVKIEQSQDDIILEVSDEGIGIPKKEQDHVFDKFFRAKNTLAGGYQGTGLGLYITKILVEHLQGKIWVKSTEGEGTTFYVMIPNEPKIKYEQASLQPIR